MPINALFVAAFGVSILSVTQVRVYGVQLGRPHPSAGGARNEIHTE